jgi:Tol biopolymer transport system component
MTISRLLLTTTLSVGGWLAAAGSLPEAAARADTADGASIAFASNRGGNWEIYVMDAAGNTERRTHRATQDRFPLWSPDGAQIAFGSESTTWELWVMDASGARSRRLASEIVAKSTRGWCRDNRRIAFTAKSGGNVDVYIGDVESAVVTRLTSTPGDDRDPSWSPDCSQLAFSSQRAGGSSIYVMRDDGSQVRRLTNHAVPDETPSWSPDGAAIAFVSGLAGARDLHTARPDGEGEQQLTRGAKATRDPLQWSPDSSRIAFQIARGENYDVGLVRVADKARIELAASPAYDGMCTWSPDGTAVAFISDRAGTSSLYRADADGRHVQRLTDTPSINPVWRRGR